MANISTPRQVAESYWRAECAHDIPAILSHYHNDAVFVPPGKRLVGHDEIKTFYEESFRRFEGLDVTIVHDLSSGERAAIEWKAVLTDALGKSYDLFGINVIKVRDGKFEEVRCYFDPALLMG
ncbi:nuclear transport factor 2 family protein [uncultured Agrobacterium sp.]|uniref:nuclear transport factor 2 family protein n=1 Tax=uncultured Agrobacterium sp. TaxID=157277 RepID=UPI0025D31022|nr:nuclear transport factor 2 family protein [uncultured Agrobacterium sp.]